MVYFLSRFLIRSERMRLRLERKTHSIPAAATPEPRFSIYRETCCTRIGFSMLQLASQVPRVICCARRSERLVVDNESKCPVSGKRMYQSEREALATAAHQIATANAPKDLRAYLCSWCDSWHLTKNARNSAKKRK
jgi:hypothetical protein